nr:MAG TPA: hypothetical protein [Caudoviricetes sp.]
MDFGKYNKQSSVAGAVEGCFPLKNYEVHVNFEGFEYIFDSHEDIIICDAYEKNERKAHALRGQNWDYLIQGIYQVALTEEAADNRLVTCYFLKKLDKFICEHPEGGYVQTIFGLKYVLVKKAKPKQAKASIEIDE